MREKDPSVASKADELPIVSSCCFVEPFNFIGKGFVILSSMYHFILLLSHLPLKTNEENDGFVHRDVLSDDQLNFIVSNAFIIFTFLVQAGER